MSLEIYRSIKQTYCLKKIDVFRLIQMIQFKLSVLSND